MKKLKNIVLLLIFLIGFAVFAYPKVSNWLAEYNQIQVVQSYNKFVTGISPAQMEEEWRRAEEYNELLQAGPITDPFSNVDKVEPFTEYDTVLNVDGVMGYIEIPSIDVKLPIYHGVSEEVLQKGVGHIKSTALPVGGEGTHAVLSAHSGLPEAKLFTELEKVKENDYFYLYVLDKEMAYKVDQITVVDPDDISNLTPVAGKDYVTLVTCTPIGINSQRLLVRGQRTEIPLDKEVNETKQIPIYWIIPIILLVMLLIIVILRKKRLRDSAKSASVSKSNSLE